MSGTATHSRKWKVRFHCRRPETDQGILNRVEASPQIYCTRKDAMIKNDRAAGKGDFTRWSESGDCIETSPEAIGTAALQRLGHFLMGPLPDGKRGREQRFARPSQV